MPKYMAHRIPCVFMRGGTSRGGFFLRSDLPDAGPALDRVVLSVYGSPDPRQIDGIGGGDPLTSKVALVAPSSRVDADVDYTFGQVGIDVADVFWVGNCGNMSAAVGPFAILRGLVDPVSPVTRVRIFNTNTGKVLVAEVPVEGGRVVEEGDARIAGVPGTAAPIPLDFGDCGGAVTGQILPTGAARDKVTLDDGRTVQVSIVDAATPFVFTRARDVGMKGTELPAEIDADPSLLRRLEEIRAYAACAIGVVGPGDLAREKSPSIPRVTVVSEAQEYKATDGRAVAPSDLSLVARQLAMQRTHKTYAVTGALCTAVAAGIPGTVVHEVAAQPNGNGSSIFNIGHPGGILSTRAAVDNSGDRIVIRETSIIRTARVIMDGYVHVPADVWPESDPI